MPPESRSIGESVGQRGGREKGEEGGSAVLIGGRDGEAGNGLRGGQAGSATAPRWFSFFFPFSSCPLAHVVAGGWWVD